MKRKLDLLITLHISSLLLSLIFNLIMLTLTMKHDKKVTGGSFK